MMNFKKLFMVSSLGIVLTLAGCGTQKTEQVTNSAQNQTKQEAPAEKQKTLTIQEGSNNMKEVIKQMKAELNNKEEDKVIKTSEGLEGNWKIFEDNVKEKYFTLYDKVEDPLHTITAAVKVKPLDVKVLNTAIDTLDKQLEQYQQSDLITTGTQNMRDALKKMKNKISQNDEERTIKTSAYLEINWKKFEDNVKAKSPELYEKIEEPLKSINAAVKIKPLDTKALNTNIDNLDKQLEQLQKLQF